MIEPFPEPIYVTRPILPELSDVFSLLQGIWEDRWLTNNGPVHGLLEREITNILKVPYVSLFNNGTVALLVACRALSVSGQVITTPFTFPATPHVLTWNNITPVFCDIDPIDLTIDSDRIESMITQQTTAILAVHVFGTPCNVGEIQRLADKYGLRVIYDAAHAFGTEIDGRGIGSFGDITMFSFHATKLFHTAEGGALTFNAEHLKHRIDLLKNFGIENEEEVVMAGINGKMNEIQAALGMCVLKVMEQERKRREAISNTYRASLAKTTGISMVKSQDHVRNSYQYFAIRIDENLFGRTRDFVHSQFKKFNVFTRKYFYPLCSEYSCYRHLPSSSRDNLPVAQKVAKEVLCLPFYGGLTCNDAEKICTILKSFGESA
jgi:dTDP-4-amino-4,6-dideoxygalactose transaminase